ncbi:hypothetical protein TRFO_09170 [Tritrichomonas foetus]|uniref:Uncharacterized protein n=1 Tax=Tritrichomonas foetus TaxID=1144522 RepID=A0A1J4JKD2_9EUKA|nr:hypothetical protein TRFO_09170 [Tritrichomonas foetus]|eukprot:OHS97995.1 hypothetical protein TRFO_09170 [Tritrichomonas foetus]
MYVYFLPNISGYTQLLILPMSSKPFVEVEKPDFDVIVNKRNVKCVKEHIIKNSPILNSYLEKNPNSCTYSLSLKYAAVDSDFKLIKESLQSPEKVKITASKFPLLLEISKAFNIELLEERVSKYADERAFIYRNMDANKELQSMKKVSENLCKIPEKTNRNFNEIFTEITKNKSIIGNESFARIAIDVMFARLEIIDNILDVVEKVEDSQQIVEIMKKLILARISRNSSFSESSGNGKDNSLGNNENDKSRENNVRLENNGNAFICRKMANRGMISNNDIKSLSFFTLISPMLADFDIKLDRQKLSREFHCYNENIERMKERNWKFHKIYCNIGHNEDPVLAILRKDSLEDLKFVIQKMKPFNYDRVVFPSVFERYDLINTPGTKIAHYASYFNAEKCLEYILECLDVVEHLKPPKNIARMAVAGGADKVLKLCERLCYTFTNCTNVAVRYHHGDILEWLIENKYQSVHEIHLVEEAIRVSNIRALEVLISKGTSLDKALVWSTKHNQHHLSKFFMEQITEVDIKNETDDETGYSPLHFACLHGDSDISLKLISLPTVNSNVQAGEEHMSPLHFCCVSGSVEISRELINREDVNVNAVDKFGRTPLHIACENGFYVIVEMLIKRCDIILAPKQNDGRTPLLLACANGHVKVMELLISTFGDNLSYDNDGEESILQSACRSGSLDAIKYAKQHTKCELKHFSPTTMTALAQLCNFQSYHHQLASFTQNKESENDENQNDSQSNPDNAQINKYNDNLINNKNDVSDQESFAAFSFLIECGCDINNYNLHGQNPLEISCKNGLVKIVEFLISQKNIVITDECFWLATACGSLDILSLLLKRKKELTKNPLPKDRELFTLKTACEKGYSQIVKLLLQTQGICVNSINDSYGPLHIACQYGYAEIVKMLIEDENVDINALGIEEETGHFLTPLHIAIRNGNIESAKLLIKNPRIDVNKNGYGVFIFIS